MRRRLRLDLISRPSSEGRRPAATENRKLIWEEGAARLAFFRAVGVSSSRQCDCPRASSLTPFAYLQHSEKRLLGDVHTADAFHALLAFLLLLEQLALAGDVAAVALGKDVFTHGMHRLARNDLGADGSLNGNFKHLAGDEFPHFGD